MMYQAVRGCLEVHAHKSLAQLPHSHASSTALWHMIVWQSVTSAICSMSVWAWAREAITAESTSPGSCTGSVSRSLPCAATSVAGQAETLGCRGTRGREGTPIEQETPNLHVSLQVGDKLQALPLTQLQVCAGRSCCSCRCCCHRIAATAAFALHFPLPAGPQPRRRCWRVLLLCRVPTKEEESVGQFQSTHGVTHGGGRIAVARLGGDCVTCGRPIKVGCLHVC